MILDAEELHQILFHMHSSLYSGVIGDINAVLRLLHKAAESQDERPHLRPLIDELEGLRISAEDILRQGAKIRTELIRLTGCDGTCTP